MTTFFYLSTFENDKKRDENLSKISMKEMMKVIYVERGSSRSWNKTISLVQHPAQKEINYEFLHTTFNTWSCGFH